MDEEHPQEHVRADAEGKSDIDLPGSEGNGADSDSSKCAPDPEASKTLYRVPKTLRPFVGTEQNDPRVKATLHNYMHCLLYSLPDEILGMILGHLEEDKPAKLCLRQVCTLLRRIMLGSTRCPPSLGMSTGTYYPCVCIEQLNLEYGGLSHGDIEELRSRLRKDTLCSECLRFCEGGVYPVWKGCKFMSPLRERLSCSGCWCCHPTRAFSAQQRAVTWDKRVCIGRDGVLRICEHRSISWKEIEFHLDQHPFPQQASFNTPVINVMQLKCHASNHMGDHPDSVHHAGPEFVLLYNVQDHCGPVLEIKVVRTVHAVFGLGDRSHFMASEVRSLFDQHRQAVSGSFALNAWQDPRANTELRCFGSEECTCLSYDHEVNANGGYKDCMLEESVLNTGSTSHIVYRGGINDDQPGINRAGNLYYRSEFGEYCQLHRFRPQGFIKATYTRKIGIPLKDLDRFRLGNIILIRPPHAWYHALDPDSYENWTSADDKVWPKCEDTSCRNYYRLFQTLGCPSGRSAQLHFHLSTSH